MFTSLANSRTILIIYNHHSFAVDIEQFISTLKTDNAQTDNE